MQAPVDPKNLISSLHYQATGELLRLMDGFYSNIEDGLFELAYAHEDPAQQRRAVELMREFRFRREHLLKIFGKRLQISADSWFGGDEKMAEYLEERIQADDIAKKCSGHFSGLLQMIAERTAHATQRDTEREMLPISPEEVSYHFVMTCRSLEMDKLAVDMVQSLFHRFVLDRLGSIYGPINLQLRDAGYSTVQELQELHEDSAIIA